MLIVCPCMHSRNFAPQREGRCGERDLKNKTRGFGQSLNSDLKKKWDSGFVDVGSNYMVLGRKIVGTETEPYRDSELCVDALFGFGVPCWGWRVDWPLVVLSHLLSGNYIR